MKLHVLGYFKDTLQIEKEFEKKNHLQITRYKIRMYKDKTKEANGLV